MQPRLQLGGMRACFWSPSGCPVSALARAKRLTSTSLDLQRLEVAFLRPQMPLASQRLTWVVFSFDLKLAASGQRPTHQANTCPDPGQPPLGATGPRATCTCSNPIYAYTSNPSTDFSEGTFVEATEKTSNSSDEGAHHAVMVVNTRRTIVWLAESATTESLLGERRQRATCYKYAASDMLPSINFNPQLRSNA